MGGTHISVSLKGVGVGFFWVQPLLVAEIISERKKVRLRLKLTFFFREHWIESSLRGRTESVNQTVGGVFLFVFVGKMGLHWNQGD